VLIRAGVLACVAVVGVAWFVTLEPGLHFRVPSMVDDWSAISKSPDQLHEVLLLGNPEPERYRPGFILWNALQWHTLGAPESLAAPQFWNLLRIALLVVGVTALTALLLRPAGHLRRLDARWLLVAAVPLTVVTAGALPIDFARFGPQEPLMVGGMALGAVLVIDAIDRLLDDDPIGPAVVATTLGGVALWAFGVLQKETSTCVLVMAPFLVPTLRRQRARWSRLRIGRKVLLCGLGAGLLLPFVPMIVRTVQLSVADSRVYEDFAENSLPVRFWEQFVLADEILHTRLFAVVALAAVVVAIGQLLSTRPDWLALGLMVTGFAFVLFAAESGVEATRYYLPPLTLLCIAIARSIASLGQKAAVALGVVAIASSLVHLPDARNWVEWWVDVERGREALVREAAALQAGGCVVSVTGKNVELVAALPVLMPLVDEPARGCEPGFRYLVVIDGEASGVTGPEDPLFSRCSPDPVPVWSSPLASIQRCTA
jgi:hypothetical protein